MPRSLRKQQSLGDHSRLGAKKSERVSRGMALYSVRAIWRARVGRDTSRDGRGRTGGRTGGERGQTGGEQDWTGGGNRVGLGGRSWTGGAGSD